MIRGGEREASVGGGPKGFALLVVRSFGRSVGWLAHAQIYAKTPEWKSMGASALH